MGRQKKAALDDRIEDWFQTHFNHLTPGQPEYLLVRKAADALKRSLADETQATQE